MSSKQRPTAWVKAKRGADPGLAGKYRVRVFGSKKRWITETEPLEVELCPYYLKRISQGDLERVPGPGVKRRPRTEGGE